MPSLRRSLTVWFVGYAALLLVAVGGALALGVRATYRLGLDARLMARAHSMLALTEWEEDEERFEVELTPTLAEQLSVTEPGQSVDVWSGLDGTLLHHSGPALRVAPPNLAARHGDLRSEVGELDVDGERVRACTVWASTVTDDGSSRTVVARVAEPIVPTVRQMGGVRLFLLPLLLVTAITVFAFGLLISRRFARPVEELTRAAEAVRPGERSAMPKGGAGAELDRLAAVLDESFGEMTAALERQTRFTADAAHELRNPIAVLQNVAEVSLRRERSTSEYREHLGAVLETSQRMARIVDSLLLLARLDARAGQSSFERFDLAALVADECQGEGRINYAGEPGPLWIDGNAGLVRVLVGNLVSNALRHTPGAVEVRVSEGEPGTARLAVRDHGTGVTADDLRRAFDRFVTLDAAGVDRGGAGLGLSLVQTIARLHGVTIRVDDLEPGLEVSVEFAVAIECSRTPAPHH